MTSPDRYRRGRHPAFPVQQFGTGIIRGIAQSHPVGIEGPLITENASLAASWFSWIDF